MPSGKTRGQQRVDEIDISPAKLLADIETLTTELADARASGEEYLSALQRERAEFQNFRRRSAEERQRDLGLAGEDLLRKVLTVADDFDLAIDATAGRQFDPREHEAIVNVPGTGRPEGEIVDELRRGYRLRDRVLRAALVAVAAPPPEAPATAPAEGPQAGDPAPGTDKQRPN